MTQEYYEFYDKKVSVFLLVVLIINTFPFAGAWRRDFTGQIALGRSQIPLSRMPLGPSQIPLGANRPRATQIPLAFGSWDLSCPLGFGPNFPLATQIPLAFGSWDLSCPREI